MVEYELAACDESLHCVRSFKLYKWETSMIDSGAAKNTENFVEVGSFSAENGNNGTIEVTFATQGSGVYFAFVDQGTCVLIQHVLVYYEGVVCSGNRTDLIEHLEVIAPQARVMGKCVANSFSNESDPILRCTEDGDWEILMPCLCGAGFEPRIISDALVCVGEHST